MTQISPEHWKEVSPYLDQLLSLPRDERASYVASFREKNHPLAGLIEQLFDELEVIAEKQFLERYPFSA